MNRINVLQIAGSFGIGGTEKVMQTFAEHLDRNFFNVYACGITGGFRKDLLEAHGIETCIVNHNQDELVRFLKDKEIHVFHIHRSGSEQPFEIEAAQKAKVLVIVETNVFGCYDSSESGQLIDMHFLVSKNAALNYVRSANISLENFLENGRVLYNPVDVDRIERFRPTEEKLEQFRSSIGVTKGNPLIGRVGRPDISKWTHFSLEMLMHLRESIPDVRYIVVGGIPTEMRDKIEEMGLEENIIDLGLLTEEELTIAYYSLDVLAHSSVRGESFGLTIAEAMAAGKPVVVNSTPWADNAQIELVDHSQTGFVANTPRKYAEAVEYLIKNKKDAIRMGKNALEKARREFDANRATKMCEKMYLELLKKKGERIGSEIVSLYESVEYFPTRFDILNYPADYKKRLSEHFGKPTLAEKVRFELKYKGQLRLWQNSARHLLSKLRKT